MADKWPSEKVRATFVDYFVKKQAHEHVVSSPVFPYDDPTLLFTNAGMNQFKPIFLGTVDPKSVQATWKRAANSQKCIRAGGKHNDLDDVGKDTYHHTFFEMLGNWSFGDYFQEEAIDWAWDLLVNTFGLDPTRIYATYFRGDQQDGLPEDAKAKAIWGKYLPSERILPFGRKENFWEMGETGPCGPCTEIHYDRVGGRDASKWVNADSPEVIEIWNLVFMAFNREESGKLTPLPAKHVDTGMGFERLTSILQNVRSNYDSDVFMPFFARIQALTGAPAYSGRLGADDVDMRDTAYRIIADHIRTLTFAITDGAQPSDSGRGYVLRRILRRAVRAGKSFLKAQDGFFHQLVDVVVDKFGPYFPELKANPSAVKNVIKHEEALFTRTLDRGLRRFEAIARPLKNGDTLGGADAFLLYGTYGFPLDLIQIMSEERGLRVDLAAFNAMLKQAREASQAVYAARQGSTKFTLSAAAVAALGGKGVAPTDDAPKYELTECEATVRAIWVGSAETGSFVEQVGAGTECGVVLDRTNFYAEGGGQIFDSGFLSRDGLKFSVTDTQVFGGYVAHVGRAVTGALQVGETVTCSVNEQRRLPIMANHTATHMVNHALRTLVNPKAEQRGSVVSEDRFRFDFDNPHALSRDQLKAVDEAVNTLVRARLPVSTRLVPLEEARQIAGVRAMFGEAYPNPVRVVAVGADLGAVLQDRTNSKWATFSIEFCGGTHIANSEDAELFAIVAEEPVSMGVRRMVAVTGDAARAAHTEADRLSKALEALASTPDAQLSAALIAFTAQFDAAQLPAYRRHDLRAQLGEQQERLRKLHKEAMAKTKASGSEWVQATVATLKQGAALIAVERLDVGGNNRVLADTITEVVEVAKAELQRDVAVLLASVDDKAQPPKAIFSAAVPSALIARGLKANEWVAEVARVLGGKGGGSPKGDVAQGHGAPLQLDAALARARSYAAEKLQ